MGYADPPYPGKAALYRGHPDFGGEVDHGRLVEQLVMDFPDGWALSTSAAETGDAQPWQAPGWVARQRARGEVPWVYMNEATWPATRQAFATAGVG